MRKSVLFFFLSLFTLHSSLAFSFVCSSCTKSRQEKCIDCVCYTPNFYDLECTCNVFVRADFLYWYVKEQDLQYAQVWINSLINENKYFKSNWSPGFRAGIGFNLPSSGWDVFAEYTYYQNKKKASTSVPFLPFLPGSSQPLDTKYIMFPYSSSFINNVFSFDSAPAKWEFTLNNIDLKIERKGYLNEDFTISPFCALRGSWLSTLFNMAFNVTTTQELPSITINFSEKFQNSFQGIGILAGLQPSWFFNENFSLFSSFDVALLWGNYRDKRRASLISNEPEVAFPFTSPLSSDNTSFMQPVLDLTLGLQYETKICEDSYRFSMSAAWEHHEWFGLIDRTDITTFTAFPGSNNIGFGGFVLNASFEF